MTRPEKSGRPAGPSGVRRPESGGDAASGTPVVIRSMREEDLGGVAEIERRAFTQSWKERTFRRLLASDRARAWTATAGGIVGYAVLWSAGTGAQLGNLAVAPGSRRQGIGRRLVRTAVAAADSSAAEHVSLEVRESNRAAIALYHDLGFQLRGRREGYYRFPREDALVLGIELR